MAGRLNARKVETLTQPGRHADGGNLYLSIAPNGGRRREMGLGSAGPNGVFLADARHLAAEARRLIRAGKDPIDARREEERAKRPVPTFAAFAHEYLAAHRPKFRNAKHAAQWDMALKTYCEPIRLLPVNEIDTEAVLKVLQPIWQRIPETASRLRGRIENVLDAAKVRGFRDGPNPAAWRGHLKTLLPARARLTRGHHAALPYDDLPAFMAALRARQGLAALALELAVPTAGRSGEVLNAEWREFDLDKAVWTVPAMRMKAGHEPRVPLGRRAVEILNGLPGLAGNPYVFPGTGIGRPLSSMAMTMQLRRMGRQDITVHGFRSTFRDWASEQTSIPHGTCEHALAHRISDKAEAAYRRGGQFDKRRKLMEAWAVYCEPRPAAKVVPLKQA
jgi:integrase